MARELGLDSDFARLRCRAAAAPGRLGPVVGLESGLVRRDLAGLRVTSRPLIDIGPGGMLMRLVLTGRSGGKRPQRPEAEVRSILPHLRQRASDAKEHSKSVIPVIPVCLVQTFSWRPAATMKGISAPPHRF
ncbi:hypothetical protein [Bradyrhizobium sp. WD16]|uniref:hypothetical protein n=1 Tax=Bradyrhizobium sp. WD16 TaxID=1521768 RepID=UPI0020A61605|nr:hypothetical protein [Bradyrhizobium sp. WD16]